MRGSLAGAAAGAAALAAGAAAWAQDGGWSASASGGGVFGATQTAVGDADVSGGYVGGAVSRGVGGGWSLGLGVDSFETTTEPDGTEASLDSSGVSGTASLSWAGEAAFVTLAGSVGSETQELDLPQVPSGGVLAALLASLAAAAERDATVYGASVSAGADHAAGAWLVTPGVAVSYEVADYDPVTIDLPRLGTVSRDPSFSTLTASAGVSLARAAGAVRPSVDAGLVYASGDSGDVPATRLAGRRLVSSGEDEVWGELGAGLAFDIGAATTLGLTAGTSLGRGGGETARVGLSLAGSW